MADSNVKEVLTDSIDNAGAAGDPNNLSLEALILLINTERLKYLQNTTERELRELKKRQMTVSELHSTLKSINNATDKDGKLDFENNAELKTSLQRAKDLGVDVKEGVTSLSREEKERLIENIRMTIEDYNVENDMQLQTISRLTNERYESYQMARSILKPLHDAKVSHAKGIKQ